ncbi:MAG TPA: chemotaxis-specific protein-glutamate methyltransferase CheB [Lysobacter sp.]|nr:chemotaxis-specific protein-glutamate methyltransferase CheB [Lysobacter sp.]
MTRVRVLVVDDSAVLRELIVHLLSSDPDIQVVGTANNGKEAVEAAKQKKPDVITMDFHMPTMNGLDATRRIMETHPVPIVVLSASTVPDEAASAFRMLEAGALAIVEKPLGIDHPDHEVATRKLLQTVKLMAEVKVVRRWPKRAVMNTPVPVIQAVRLKPMPSTIKLVAFGASTGGPIVLKTILSGLPKNFPVPIVIVQHIADGFAEGLAEWLTQSSGILVHVAMNDQELLPGHAYVAPVGRQMMLGKDGRIALSDGGLVNGHSPSVSCLFRSVAEVLGRDAIGVLLTGMGKDGAEELKLLKDRGAITFVQDRETSVVHGMPGEAIQLDAATHVLTPDEISAALGSLAH